MDIPVTDEDGSSIFARVSAGDMTAVQSMLSNRSFDMNQLDEHGMTLLEHAAYRGKKEMCQLLLDWGASICAGTQNNGYTALHFAALSGNADLCRFLMMQGAKPYILNSVGRTAAQMAAFVGNHKCACTINAFIEPADVEYFTATHGFETSPKLPAHLFHNVYNLILQTNFHPVKIALLVGEEALLIKDLEQVTKVLGWFVEREMSKGSERNELLGMKVHLVSHTMGLLRKSLGKLTKKENTGHSVEPFIKNLLKCETPGGIPENLDILLRQGVRSFRHSDCGIMRQILTGLTQVKISQYPGAWGVISSLVNGQKGFKDAEPCSTCGEEEGGKQCSRCHFDVYCDKVCQRIHWGIHKKYCQAKALEYANRMKNKHPVTSPSN